MRCGHCPVRDGLTCFGERHRPMCDHVKAGQPGRAEQLVAMAEGTPVIDTGKVDPHLAMRADLCIYGSGACGCGSTPRLCGHPDRPAEVWRATCLECVARTSWESAADPVS